jgi:hypothetical protein
MIPLLYQHGAAARFSSATLSVCPLLLSVSCPSTSGSATQSVADSQHALGRANAAPLCLHASPHVDVRWSLRTFASQTDTGRGPESSTGEGNPAAVPSSSSSSSQSHSSSRDRDEVPAPSHDVQYFGPLAKTHKLLKVCEKSNVFRQVKCSFHT